MIYLYSGTPGSGKSLHAARDVVNKLRRGHTVIANFPVNLAAIKKARGNFIYRDNSEMTIDYLVNYALNNHVIGKENQSLIIIDEAQVLFNCRDFQQKDRLEWVKFFSQHRKFGYNIILVAQNDRMVDRQIRSLVEYEIKHRKINNYGVMGILASLTFNTYFVAIEYWYGMKGKEARLGCTFFKYKKKYADIYNSYQMFDIGLLCKGDTAKPRGLPLHGRQRKNTRNIENKSDEDLSENAAIA